MSEFSAQVRELIPRLRRYARALTGERSAADDLVQDTLERAWVKLHLWRSGSDLPGGESPARRVMQTGAGIYPAPASC